MPTPTPTRPQFQLTTLVLLRINQAQPTRVLMLNAVRKAA
jgi:hypothetical protein